jgi:hypothetical protein
MLILSSLVRYIVSGIMAAWKALVVVACCGMDFLVCLGTTLTLPRHGFCEFKEEQERDG